MHSVAAMNPATTPPAASARWSPRLWGILVVLCGALFLDALDVSMVGVALPSIRADLGLSTASLQWVVSGYVLGYGGFLLLGGRAADLLGRRRVFLAALAVFAVASLLGGLVSSGPLLIAARLITEVGWRWTLLLPAPVAAVILAAALRLIPRHAAPARNGRRFDIPGAVTVTAAMLRIVATVVEAPQ